MILSSICRQLAILCIGLLASVSAAANAQEQAYSRLNTFSGFFEYSNDSSHIILGSAMNRKIGALGIQYQRRIVHRRVLDFSYQAEFRPGMLESDPTEWGTEYLLSPISTVLGPTTPQAVDRCVPFTTPVQTASTLGVTYTYYDRFSCGRRTVIEQGFDPAGLRVNLMPRHRLQLTFSTDAGYIFATREVPVPRSGSFNFCFDFGGGLEFYRTSRNSLRLEYQVQHFSNKDTGNRNPGVDSGFVRVTYAFGR